MKKITTPKKKTRKEKIHETIQHFVYIYI